MKICICNNNELSSLINKRFDKIDIVTEFNEFNIKIDDTGSEIVISNIHLPHSSYNFKKPIRISEIYQIIQEQLEEFHSILIIKNYKFYPNTQKLFQNDFEVLITSKESELIEYLFHHPGGVEKDKIMKDVYNYANDSDSNTLRTHIYSIRQKTSHDFIVTTENGYMLNLS